MFPFILAATFYAVTAVYSDGSCLSMTFRADDDCRVGEPAVWCPSANDPCEARERAEQADILWPECSPASEPIPDPIEDIE